MTTEDAVDKMERLRAEGWQITAQSGPGMMWAVLLWSRDRTISVHGTTIADAVAAAAADAS